MIPLFDPVFPAASVVIYTLASAAGFYGIRYGNPDLVVEAVLGVIAGRILLILAAWARRIWAHYRRDR